MSGCRPVPWLLNLFCLTELFVMVKGLWENTSFFRILFFLKAWHQSCFRHVTFSNNIGFLLFQRIYISRVVSVTVHCCTIGIRKGEGVPIQKSLRFKSLITYIIHAHFWPWWGCSSVNWRYPISNFKLDTFQLLYWLTSVKISSQPWNSGLGNAVNFKLFKS